MDKSNLELFKQAISEGVSNRFNKLSAECTEEITFSDKHKLAMQTIIYGKTSTKRTLSPKARWIVAILVAIALAFTSCGIIFHNEMRQLLENVCDFFVALTYTEDDAIGTTIEEVYELGYLPEGYSLTKEKATTVRIQYEFKNENGDYLWFEQKLLDGTDFVIDSEEGYSQIEEVTDYKIYYRYTNKNHVYVWNDGKHSVKLKSSVELPVLEITMILNGIKIR